MAINASAAIISGGTGIGLATAMKLAQLSIRVLVAAGRTDHLRRTEVNDA